MPTAKTKTEEVKIDIPLKGVYAKLQAARIALMDKGLKKSGKNTFANFDFFQLVDFLPEAQRIFTKLGLTTNYTLAPRVVAYNEIVEGERIIKEPIIKDIARLVIKDIETSEETTFEMEAAPVQIGNNTKQNIYQAAGGRSTYYKRYLYRDALEIEESDESDMVLGQPNVEYQTPQQVTPYQFESPKAAPIQEAVVSAPQAPTQDIGQQVVINNSGEVQANSDTLLSVESKGEIMNMIMAKGLVGYDVINNFCAGINIVPANLLESHKQSLIDYVNSL